MAHPHNVNPSGFADVIFVNGRIATQDERDSSASALAIRGDRFAAVGDERSIAALRGPATRVIDAGGRAVIPGLNDSHIHVIRGGLNYHLELRWDGVPSLADALRMLREQARRTPAPQWVRVVGGWSEFQFAERRVPTLEELNAAAPDTPVFVLHLYDRAVAAASGAASVRVWHITSRGWDPWTERPLPEVVRAAYPPDAVHNHSFSASRTGPSRILEFQPLGETPEGRFLTFDHPDGPVRKTP
jgi:hypothetical protein